MKFAVIGHYTSGNLGDEASAAAIIENICLRAPAAEVICISLKPKIAKVRYNREAFPLRFYPELTGTAESHETSSIRLDQKIETIKSRRRNLVETIKNHIKKISIIAEPIRAGIRTLNLVKLVGHELGFLYSSYFILRDVDTIIVAGSGTLQDLWGGPWGHPYTLFKWSVLAKIAGCKFKLASCGAIQFTTRTGTFLIKRTLKQATFISFRDKDSQKTCNDLGINRNSFVFPDIAHSYPLLKRSIRLPQEDNGTLKVGINPVPIYGSEYDSDSRNQIYQNYIGAVVKLVEHLQKCKHRPIFYANNSKDVDVVKDILDQLGTTEGIEDMSLFTEVTPLIEKISKFDLTVASRFHGIIFPLAQCIPTVSISKDIKQIELMKSYELSSYSLPIENIDPNKLIEVFESLATNRKEIHSHLVLKKHSFISQLDAQYDEILGRFSP